MDEIKKSILLLLLLPMMAVGQFFTPNGQYMSRDSQVSDPIEYYNLPDVVTDSIVWITIQVLNVGDVNCKHRWVYSKEVKTSNIGCLVDHKGFHCNWNDMEKYRICKICLRKEHQREKWYQHKNYPKKTEYEVLDSLIINKK